MTMERYDVQRRAAGGPAAPGGRQGWIRRALTGLAIGVAVVVAATACDPTTPPVVTPPGGTVDDTVAAVVSTNPADNTPWVLDGKVWNIAKVGNRILVGGDFTKVQDAGNGTTYAQPYVFAYDPVTG